MKILIKDREYSIKDIKSIYPCAIVDYENQENTPISLEWLDQNINKVKIKSYAIIFLFKNSAKKEEIYFNNLEEMYKEMDNILEKLKK